MTAAGMILGTAGYMSPEQARGKPVDKRADIWAFGVVLYEMLTGRVAFAGDTVTDVIAAVVTREPDWSALPRRRAGAAAATVAALPGEGSSTAGCATSAKHASRCRVRGQRSTAVRQASRRRRRAARMPVGCRGPSPCWRSLRV